MADTPTSPPRAESRRIDTPLTPGRVFAGHEILREAGRGGMGVVYAARHVALRVVRALKVLTDETAREPVFRARFERESQLAAALEHPNVVQVYEAGESEGALYLSMRFVDGPNLAQVLADGPLSADRVADVVEQVAAALDAAHEAGLVHRDVKPANIMLEEARGGRRVFLGDFGISRMLAATGRLTETGEMLGTVNYVAPEQIAGEAIDGRADVYSLACVVFEALTGRAPFARETRLATMFAHANAPRPAPSELRPELPAGVDAVFAHALAADPAERYERASAFARDLEAALAGRPVSIPSPGRRRPRSAILGAIGALIALALLAGVLAIVGVFGGGGSTERTGANSLPAPPAKVVGTVSLAHPASALSIGQLNLWTASGTSTSIAAVVPTTADRARPPIALPSAPSAILAAFGSVWVTEPSADALLRVDPSRPRSLTRIPVGERPADIAASASHLWVANEGDDTVSRVDPVANRADRPQPAGDAPASLAIGEGGVWVADSGSGMLSNLDPASGKPQAKPIQVGGRPTAVAAGEAGVWVIDSDGGRLLRVSPGSGDVRAVSGIADPVAVTTGFGYAWVATRDGVVQRVDPARLRPAGDPIRVGGKPTAVAAGDGFVWTTDADASRLVRIDPTAGG